MAAGFRIRGLVCGEILDGGGLYRESPNGGRGLFHHLPLERLVGVSGLFFLVLEHLAVELVGQGVDGGVQVSSWASTKMSLPRTCTVTSAFCRSFSTDRMTCTLVTLSKCRITRSSLEVT
jgi:hypothetical protein